MSPDEGVAGSTCTSAPTRDATPTRGDLSVETAEMRRSTLQRKDREELTLIATTLGRKPSSRARKGEIIDLILDLAAGGDGSSVGVDAPDTADDPPAAEAESAKSNSDESDESDEKSDDTHTDEGSERPVNENAEPGNRRRRRRGRDRENNKDSNDQWDGEPIPTTGYLELRPEGYGFLRVDGALPSKDDAYVPVKMVRQLGLRKGDHLAGTSRPANRNEKNPAMTEIESVNGGSPESVVDRVEFDSLPAVYPSEQIRLSGSQDSDDPTTRVIDLLTPIGKGQRALLAAAPRTGKTTILQQVIRSIESNHPDLELLVLLIDERPEDITEMTRWLERGDVIASAFDRPADEHISVTEMVIERAKRLVESGKDVVVIADGVTRLARAYAQEAAGGRSGVIVDAATVYPAKRFLGAARKLEGGGSLTMIATITVDTESAVDTLIYEELAGTANLELRLDRAAAVRRVFPAVDVGASATVHEERLRGEDDLAEIRALRRELATIADDPEREASADLQALLEKIAAS
jgi:transcription termination factor Rho